VLLWSTVFPLSKLLLEVVPPTSLAAIRFGIGGLVLLCYAIYAFSWRVTLLSLKRSYKDYILLGIIGIFSNNLLQNLGLARTSASSASLLGAVDPLFTTLLSVVFLRETFTRIKGIGLIMAFLGVVLVTTNGQRIDDWGQGLGNLLIVGAALGYSVYTILSKKILTREEPPIVVAWTTVIGSLLLMAASLILDSGAQPAILKYWHIAALVYLSIAPTSVAVVAYFYLLQRIQASQAAVTLFLIPIIAVAWSMLLLGETVSWAMILGGSFIIVGVWITLKGGSLYSHPPTTIGE